MISPENYTECSSKYWDIELCDYNIKFKFLKGFKTPLLIPCLSYQS